MLVTDYYWFGPKKETQMSEIIGRIGSLEIEKYSVLQVNDDNGKGWLDFSTLREPWEFDIAVRMVNNRGGVNDFRVADYRIWQNNEPVYVRNPNRIVADDIEFEMHDVLQVHRFDDQEDIEAGWVPQRVICTIEDAKVAVERCSRFRTPECKRHHRVLTNQGAIRLSQDSYNSLRLSGIIWQADPIRPLRITEVETDRYDRYAARIIEGGSEWDTLVVPILDELGADQDLRDRIYSFVALTI
jgi:hypothetical protein